MLTPHSPVKSHQTHLLKANNRAARGSATKRRAKDDAWRPHRLSDRIPEQLRQEIVSAYAEGESAYVLAATYGVGRNTVLALANEAGVPRKIRRMSETETDEAVRLYQQGYSFVAIGKLIGFGPTAVADALKRRDITARPRRGRNIV